jgi:hypothetical protein
MQAVHGKAAPTELVDRGSYRRQFSEFLLEKSPEGHANCEGARG